ncbi:MAG: PEP-CTERM sorting domain-containing protein [Verrucomicrobia bacterium]|nr:PEP-CTERM sorting domain-containing protein [Verrucomicrobiota bacterium]
MKNIVSRLVLGGLVSFAALGQEFDFNAGNDDGLTRYDPLGGFGIGGTYTFPGGDTYRIQSASTTPLTGTVGPGRAGAYLAVSYDSFTASVDLVNWDDNLVQGFGLLGRAQEAGLGTSDGYVFFYFPAFQSVAFNRIDNESATVLASPENPMVSLDPSQDYRMVFSAHGSQLFGQIFALNDLSTPLVTLTATDSTYSSGFAGLLVAGTLMDPTSAGDATFDNFKVIPEPSTLALAVLGGGALFIGARARRR